MKEENKCKNICKEGERYIIEKNKCEKICSENEIYNPKKMECDNICNEFEIYNYKSKECEPKDEDGIDDCEGYSMPENGTCICIDGYIREGGECVNGKK